MNTNTNININKIPLTKAQKDSILENKQYTVNLTWELSSKEKADKWMDKRVALKTAKFRDWLFQYISIALMVWLVCLIINGIVNKDYTVNSAKPNNTTEVNEVIETKEVIQSHVNFVLHAEASEKVDESWKIIREAMDMIKELEWVRYKAYYDHKQWSICYWTKSTYWATASHDQCHNLLWLRVASELERINKIAPWLERNKKVALISFMYNVWFKKHILQYAKKWDDASVVYLMSQYNMGGWKYLQGLQNRRYKEIEFYNLNK